MVLTVVPCQGGALQRTVVERTRHDGGGCSSVVSRAVQHSNVERFLVSVGKVSGSYCLSLGRLYHASNIVDLVLPLRGYAFLLAI